MRRSLVLLALTLLVASACQSGTASPRATVPEQWLTPVRGGRVVEGSFADAKTFAPFLASDNTSLTVSGLVYASLYRVEPKTGELLPNLGTWTVSADGRTYHWRIAPDARWSDGRPIIGDDYLTGVKAVARSKRAPRAAAFAEIEGFEAYRSGGAATIAGIALDPADPKAFSVRFSRVFCPALTGAFGSAAGPLPTHVYGRYTGPEGSGPPVDEAPENSAPPVASGPFVFKSWRPNDAITLDRNDAYFRGAPHLEQYVLSVVPDVTTLITRLKTGDVTFGPIEPRELDDLKKRDDLIVHSFQDLSYNFIGWNTRSALTPALADKRVRQALAYGLDMNAVVRDALQGQGTRVYQHHHPSSWAAADPATLNTYPYDRRKAEDLLRSAGYTYGPDSLYQKDGKRLELVIMTNSGNRVREALLDAAVAQYKRIGIKVTPRLVPFEAMTDILTSRSEDVSGWIVGWRLSVEPDPNSTWHSSAIPDATRGVVGYNFGAFSSPAADRAIEAARAPADGDCGLTARKKSYVALNRLLNEEQPYHFGFAPTTLLAAAKVLRGFEPATFGTHSGVEGWWLAR